MDTPESTVEYRDIPNFPGYRIGSDGSVWTCKNNKWGVTAPWRRLAIFTKPNGYLVVSLWQDNHRTQKMIHILLLEAFVSPRPLGMWGLHRNDQRQDNRLDNLYWGSHADNVQDATTNKRLHGGGVRLTKGEVIAIRLLTEQGINQSEIARRLGLELVTVRSIATGRTRNNVN
jgi:hypothetical protein